ncbi:MAG: hypothetical protein ACE14M_12040 [Terriglobales bacterium]
MSSSERKPSPSSSQSTTTPVAMPGPSVELDLSSEIELLHGDETWQAGISRKNLARYPGFRINLIAMKANSRIDEHENAGRISVHTVRGHIRMQALGKVFDLPAGHVLVLDRAVRHNVEALEESAFLLTVARPESESSR